MPVDVTVDDFMAGLLAGLALEGQKAVSIRGDGFYERVQDAYSLLLSRKGQYDLDIRFVISQHPLHGDSPVVRDAISTAVKRDLVSLDNPEYQDMTLKLSPRVANGILARLPGGSELFTELAREFLEGSAKT
jgi:hypothetical protein